MQKLDLKPNYDVVIIGSGPSGLTSAALLSRAGLSVCVLEMDIRPGGYLAGFRRKNFRFDTAIHWLNQCGPGGMVNRVFNLIGTEHPTAVLQKRIRRYVGKDFDYLLTNNPDDFRDKLIEDFPHEKKGIIKLFSVSKKMGKSIAKFGTIYRTPDIMTLFEKINLGINKLRFVLPFLPYVMYSGEKGVPKGLNRFFKDEKLHELFRAESDLLSCLIPIAWAYIGDFQSPPKGGSQAFPEWLSYVINYYQNSVYFKCRVNKILLENNRCTGVSFEHRGDTYEVKSKYVIAACDVETLYEKMLPESAIPEKLKRKLNEAVLYSSSVTLSIALDCPTEDLGFNEELIHLTAEGVKRDDHGSGDPHQSSMSILAPSLRDPSMAPKGMGTLTIYIPAFFDYKNTWQTEIDENGKLIRGEKYKELKEEYADIMIKRVEDLISPGLSDHILFCEVATPITHWRYTGNRNGTMMGAKPGKENMQAKIAHYKTPIENLLLGGHWADLGGGVPIAVRSATNTALLVLHALNKPAFKVISQYLEDKISLKELNESEILLPYDNSWIQALTPAEKIELRDSTTPRED